MLGFLLARSGVEVVVLEKHADFFRDFRGDTIHPSTMDVLDELGMADEFLALHHQQFTKGDFFIDGETFTVVDFTRVHRKFNFISLVPQWDFLDFLSDKGKEYPGFQLLMETEAQELVFEGHRVVGVRAEDPRETVEIRAKLVVGCDGRHSIVREQADLESISFGVPIDVLWMRIDKPKIPFAQTLAYVHGRDFMVMFDRADYLQSAFLIDKGGLDAIKVQGLEEFKKRIVTLAPFVETTVDSIRTWDDVKLLTVRIDRLKKWSAPGLLCIGDAAHAMSPVGGVGINLAIQDAVAAANLLALKLRDGTLSDDDLTAVQRRRQWPTRVLQRMQIFVHNSFLGTSQSSRMRGLKVLRWVTSHFPFVRGIIARFMGYGPRPEHVGG